MNYNAYPFGRWIKWGIAALVAFILIVSAVSTYNGLVTSDQQVQRNWSQVENVMQERADKITNLVEVVKGYTKHEEKVFQDIAAARAVLNSGASDVKSKITADDKINEVSRQVLVLVENYPDLKASQQFHDLQKAIDEAENKVAVERKRFIDSVHNYNTKIKRFPGSVFAGMMGFGAKDYFEASPGAQDSPKIEF
jgi:LemA protein